MIGQESILGGERRARKRSDRAFPDDFADHSLQEAHEHCVRVFSGEDRSIACPCNRRCECQSARGQTRIRQNFSATYEKPASAVSAASRNLSPESTAFMDTAASGFAADGSPWTSTRAVLLLGLGDSDLREARHR